MQSSQQKHCSAYTFVFITGVEFEEQIHSAGGRVNTEGGVNSHYKVSTQNRQLR